jgi:hypothetical protein
MFQRLLFSALITLSASLAIAQTSSTTVSDLQTVSFQDYSNLQSRLLDLEARLAAVEQPVAPASYNTSNTSTASCTAAGCTTDGCTTGCTTCTTAQDCQVTNCLCQDWLNPSCGAYADAQLVFLRAFDSELSANSDSFASASRYTLGYMRSDATSVRIRYFEYGTLLEQSSSVNLEMLDAEYAGRFCLGKLFRAELSGGFRWASFDEDDNLNYENTYGLLLGLTVRGPQLVRCWEPFFTLRHSFQFGNSNFLAQNDSGPFIFRGRGTFNITEMQLGMTRDFCTRWGQGFVSVFAESNYWSGVYQSDSQDLGLAGGGFAIGFTG